MSVRSKQPGFAHKMLRANVSGQVWRLQLTSDRMLLVETKGEHGQGDGRNPSRQRAQDQAHETPMRALAGFFAAGVAPEEIPSYAALQGARRRRLRQTAGSDAQGPCATLATWRTWSLVGRRFAMFLLASTVANGDGHQVPW